jgi:hypothetical protein
MMIFNFLAADNRLKAPNIDSGQVLGNAISLALWGIGVLSVLIIIYAAFLIVTAHGDVEKAKKGRLAITWGMVGFGITLMTGIITSLLTNTFG